MAGDCMLWPACLYIPALGATNKWIFDMTPIGWGDTPSLPTATPLRETLLAAGDSSDVEAPKTAAFSRLDERLERMEKLQLEQAHRGRVYFTYAFLTLIAILYKLQAPDLYGVYSIFNVYVALILYMAIKRNSVRAIQGVWLWIGFMFLISALIFFITKVIKPMFDGGFGLLLWLGWWATQGSQAAPVATPPPPPPQ